MGIDLRSSYSVIYMILSTVSYSLSLCLVHECTVLVISHALLVDPAIPLEFGTERKFKASQLKLKFRAVHCAYSVMMSVFLHSAFTSVFSIHSLLSFIHFCLFIE